MSAVDEPPAQDTAPPEAEPQDGAPADDSDERWLDEHAGPLVRPYVMTRGRTKPVRGSFDLVTLVEATELNPVPELGLGPEHLAVLRVSERAISVAEIAAHMRLPTVTVRVLLGDLLDRGLITVQDPEPESDLDDDRVYQEVIDGLRAL